MITSEYYEKDFQEFLHYKQYDDIEEALSYSKSFDIENFNINAEETSNKIVDEVKTWKKFHKNNFRKANIRDFEPFVTQGAIADFIESQLNLFDKNGNMLPLSDIIQNKIQKELVGVRKASSKLEAVRRSGLLFNEIKNRFTDPVKKKEVEESWKEYLLDAKTNVTAEDVYNTIKNSLPKPLKKILGGNTQKELVNFLFGNLTSFDINSDNISEILLKDWNSFLKNSFFGTKNKIRSKDVFDTVLKVFNNYQSDFDNVKKLFSLNFNDTVSKFLNKKFNQLDFGITIRKVVRTYGRQAFRSSIKILGLSPSDFRIVERLIVNTVVNESEKFILGLAGKLGQGLVSIGDSLVKSDSWINKTINKIWQLGKLSADRNGLYEWVFGETKHCASCLQASGQRHRLIHWHNSGILPQSTGHKELICRGFHCQCKLVRVTGKARGRLDRIKVLN